MYEVMYYVYLYMHNVIKIQFDCRPGVISFHITAEASYLPETHNAKSRVCLLTMCRSFYVVFHMS